MPLTESARPQIVLRQVLGLSPESEPPSCAPALEKLLGPPRSPKREDLLERGGELLATVWNESQRELFLNWNLATLVVDSVPGAGKTTMELLLMFCVLSAPAGYRMLFVGPNKAVCADLYVRATRLADKLGMHRGIARIGFDEDEGDRMKAYLNEVVAQMTTEEHLVLGAVDNVIELAHGEYASLDPEGAHSSGSSFGPRDETTVTRCASLTRLVCAMLALRHEYLNTHVYALQEARQKEALLELRVVIGTTTKATECIAGLDRWSDLLRMEGVWGVNVDEYQQPGWEQLIPMAFGVDFMAFWGDVDQREDNHGASRSGGAAASSRCGPGEDPQRMEAGGQLTLQASAAPRHQKPLQQHGAPAWFKRNKYVQHERLLHSMRLGPTMVRLLQGVFPERHDDLLPGRPIEEDTLFLPVIFEHLRDWKYNTATEEIQRSATFFSHLATLMAPEVVSLLNGPEAAIEKGILVLSFLLDFLAHVAAFMSQHLPGLCKEYHLRAGFPVPRDGWHVYDHDALQRRGALAYSAALKAGGRDCHISFLCIPHRQKRDHTWKGNMTKRNLLMINLTRASGKCYCVMEDLRGGRGLSYAENAGQQSLVRLVTLGMEEWHHLGVPAREHSVVATDSTALSPIMRSPIFLGSLGLIHDVDDLARHGYDTMFTTLLDMARSAYEGTSWPEAHALADAHRAVQLQDGIYS